jgi:hypothetical protein
MIIDRAPALPQVGLSLVRRTSRLFRSALRFGAMGANYGSYAGTPPAGLAPLG